MDTTSILFLRCFVDWGDTNLVKDPDRDGQSFEGYLGLDRDKILAQLTQNNVYQVELGNADNIYHLKLKRPLRLKI